MRDEITFVEIVLVVKQFDKIIDVNRSGNCDVDTITIVNMKQFVDSSMGGQCFIQF